MSQDKMSQGKMTQDETSQLQNVPSLQKSPTSKCRKYKATQLQSVPSIKMPLHCDKFLNSINNLIICASENKRIFKQRKQYVTSKR